MGNIPKDAVIYSLEGLDVEEAVRLIRSQLMKHNYLYSNKTQLICTTTKWWDEDNLREDGHDT